MTLEELSEEEIKTAVQEADLYIFKDCSYLKDHPLDTRFIKLAIEDNVPYTEILEMLREGISLKVSSAEKGRDTTPELRHKWEAYIALEKILNPPHTEPTKWRFLQRMEEWTQSPERIIKNYIHAVNHPFLYLSVWKI